MVDLHIDVKDALIVDAVLFSDCLFADVVTVFNETNVLKGVRYDDVQEIRSRLLKLWSASAMLPQPVVAEFSEWVQTEIKK